jgi:predicted phosphoribosyltransferase
VPIRYRNRAEAGRALAGRLALYAQRSDVVVLALPRGGVPVAFEIARALSASLDVFVVRKLGVPGHGELAMGAIASGGIRVLNPDVVAAFGLGERELEMVAARELDELRRREAAYRRDRPPPVVAGRVVILVDDGLATGATMRAAIAALRVMRPARIVVAVPVGARDTVQEIAALSDELVCPLTPAGFAAVGEWYEDFSETSDEQVRRLLEGRSAEPFTR